MKVVELPEEDAKRFRQMAYETAWKKFVPASPEYGKKIREMARPFENR